jgi:hypothetical protein
VVFHQYFGLLSDPQKATFVYSMFVLILPSQENLTFLMTMSFNIE